LASAHLPGPEELYRGQDCHFFESAED
jgi:hypothetical protein